MFYTLPSAFISQCSLILHLSTLHMCKYESIKYTNLQYYVNIECFVSCSMIRQCVYNELQFIGT